MVHMSTNNRQNQIKGKNNHNKSIIKTGGLIAVLIVIISIVIFTDTAKSDEKSERQNVQTSGDIIINKSEIGTNATFYAYEVDGVDLEVLAIKASDGTIRTAFNTCQVCYSSGRGYYEQEGDHLVCQNCGNTFTTDNVQVVSGGCNPIPIFAEDKTETDESITIDEDFLRESKDMFLNWK